jgi:holo-[acyl-carrier protein] synthase
MLGIDIVENERIRRGIEKFGERFLKRIFTEGEVEYCKTYKDWVPCLAARWAAKEAVIKAFFPIFGKVLRFKQIEIKGRKGLPPTAVIHGKEGDLLKRGGYRLVVSIAHERKFSVAVAQIIREKGPDQEER